MPIREPIGYHSIFLPMERVEERDRWTDGKSVAFVHDIAKGALPEEYGDCDVLYADLPWRAGYDEYLARAGIPARSGERWPAFMANVGAIVAKWNKPAVVVTGAHARSALPPASQELRVRMPVSGSQLAIAYVYNAGFTAQWDRTDGLLDYLAARFSRVGDFCAGYGWAPRAFARAGGSFVASDVNPRCVGYIAENAADWKVP